MKITREVREYAEAHGLEVEEALREGMADRAEEFAALGGEIYRKA